MLERAIQAKIRLHVERDQEGVYRVYYDPENTALVMSIFAHTTWIPKPLPHKCVRVPYAVPRVVDLPYPAKQRTKRFYTQVSEETIGNITFFDCIETPAREMRRIAQSIRKARNTRLSLAAEVAAVEQIAGKGYFVNLNGEKTYLYRRA